jgi:predicted RNA methylase
VEFSRDSSEDVQIHENLRIERNGYVNGLILKSFTEFTGGTSLDNCISYCHPVILPTKETVAMEGDLMEVSLAYKMGEGFDSLRYDVRLAR